MPPFPHGGRLRRVRHRPDPAFARTGGLDHLQAAALPLAGLTAWQALVDTARLAPGSGS